MSDAAPGLADAIAELEAHASGALASDHYYQWIVPQPLADGSFVNGYCDYKSAMDRLWSAFAAAGLDSRPADYNEWLQRTEAPFDPDRIARMDEADLNMLLLAIRRGERFCDGHWAAMVRDGVFLAIAHRLLALRA
jgi:hypothetical protein